MRTNYFQITQRTDKELFKYSVKIEPVPDSGARALQNSRKRRQFYKNLFQEQSDFRALGQGIATDYANTLITCGRLYKTSLPFQTYLQVYRGVYEQPGSQNSTEQSSEQKYKVTVEYVEEVSISELIRYIHSEPHEPSNINLGLSTVQAMNIIVAGSPNKNPAVFQAGQNKFFHYPRNQQNQPFNSVYHAHNLDNGLIAVRGYYSSVRTSTSRVLLNLNVQCSAFYPEINLLELMKIFSRGSPPTAARYQDLEDFIQRLRVRTDQMTSEEKIVTREKTIRGFSHKYEEVRNSAGKQIFNPDHSPKMKGTKGATHDYGSSESITFLSDAYSPARVVSISTYFLERGFFASFS